MTVVNGYQAMITQHGWMFLSSFEKMRLYMLQFSISSMAHLGARAFDEIGGEVVQSVAFVMRNSLKLSSYKGNYVQLTDYTGEAEKERHYFQEENRFINGQSAYSRIPGSPIAYWCTQNVIKSFEEAPPLSKIAEPRQGVKTLNNDLFLKLWFEVNYDNISFDSKSIEDSVASGKKWFPYNKGGTYRKWYGNNDYLVNWYNDGFDMKKLAVEKYHSVTRTITNISYFFKPGLTWSSLSSGNISLRAFGVGYIFDSKGSSMFFVDERQKYYVLALINSKVSMKFLEFLAPTLDFNIGPLSKIPVKLEPKYYKEVDALVQDNIDIAKEDWDSFETSWDFQVHPLVSAVSKYSDRFADPQNIDIATCYECWANECEKRFNELKTNEVQLNKIFIDVYGLEDEMTPDITDEEVTVRKAELQRDIKGLISFAVGCMFGRYSLATKGIVYSGGAWPSDKYGSYLPDADGIIPICDDEYFEDDIVGKFVEFIRVVYGERTLEANLSFIASALGGKGSARDVLRNYFINDFYSDHCNTYSVSGSGKRPIYWLFDSGKKNGFKCLIYMHRYHPDTIARIRTDYVHEQQSRYRTAIADLEQRISIANTSDRVKLNKQLSVLQAQAEEIRTYEEKIHHLADQMISIDLDDGVKQNYEIFKDVLAKIK